MCSQLLEIRPCELKFTFEVNKQSSCSISLANASDQYVIFKVKTTSPSKYCVRPNIGIVKPKLTCDVTVTMQGQHSAVSDMQCRDKFLIQSTVVPFGTTEDDITPGMFVKDSGTYIEETKLRVILLSPPPLPVLLPINGVSEQGLSHNFSIRKETLLNGIENHPPLHMSKDVEGVKNNTDKEFVTPAKGQGPGDLELCDAEDEEPRSAKDVNGLKLSSLSKDIEELKLKKNVLDKKLIEAGFTIKKIEEDRRINIKENGKLKQELAMLRRMRGGRKGQVGFPALFLCMVGLVGIAVGYLMHS